MGNKQPPLPFHVLSFIDFQSMRQSKTIKEDVLALKTYGQLKEDHNIFSYFGTNKKLTKRCHSVVNLPLFEENDDLTVLERCVIPELHILQGLVNHIFWKGLVSLLGEETALIWPETLTVIAQDYHGKVFEGNACRKLVRNSDELLLNPCIYGEVGKLALVPFVDVFKAMDKIIDNCFSSHRNKTENLDTLLTNFRRAYEATELTVTLKFHVLLEHLTDCLKLLNNAVLELYSKQAGEAIHSEFLKFWKKYKVKLLSAL